MGRSLVGGKKQQSRRAQEESAQKHPFVDDKLFAQIDQYDNGRQKTADAGNGQRMDGHPFNKQTGGAP